MGQPYIYRCVGVAPALAGGLEAELLGVLDEVDVDVLPDVDAGVEELLAGGRLRGRHAVRLQALRLVDARREEGRALEEKKSQPCNVNKWALSEKQLPLTI